MPFFIYIFRILQKSADTRKKLPPLKPILALPTWGQNCFNSEAEPFEITDFDLGHPVPNFQPIKKGFNFLQIDYDPYLHIRTEIFEVNSR